MACKYYYKGKELSYEEFAELLQNGLLQETLKRIEAGKPPVEPPKGKTTEGEGGRRLNDKGILNALFSAENVPSQAKAGFEEKGLKYKTADQSEAEAVAKGVIDQLGIDDAVAVAQMQKFDGDVNSLIYAESLNRLSKLEAEAKTPQEKFTYAERFKEIAIAYDEAARSGGRFNAAIDYFYKRSPLGIKLIEQERRSEEFKKWFKNKEKDYKLVFEEIVKEPEFQDIIKGEVEKQLKEERKQYRQERRKKIEDFFDSAKLKKDGLYATPIPPQVINAGIEAMKQAFLAGESVLASVEAAVSEISNKLGKQDWDKEKFKKEWEEKLGKIEAGKVGKSKEELSEEKRLKILEKFRNKLKGLSEKEKDEIIRKSFKKLVESGALEYEDFKKIIADTLGYGEMTAEEAARLEQLVKDINAVDELANKIRTEDGRSIEALREYQAAKKKAEKSATELGKIVYNKPDITKRLLSYMQLNTLGIPSLVNNPVFNIVNQALVRFPIGVQMTVMDKLIYGGSKVANSIFGTQVLLPENDVLSSQKEFFKKSGVGLKESTEQIFNGLTSRDYFQKEVYASQTRPVEAMKDIYEFAKGEKRLSGAQLTDKALQSTIGIPAEFVARLLNVGDKPQRYAAEAAKAAVYAKNLGLRGVDYEYFMEFPKEEAFRYYQKKGLSAEEAGKKAQEIKDAIVKQGEESVFQEDNMLANGIDALFKNFGTAGEVFKKFNMPFMKIPLNAFWSGFNLINPEVAFAQSLAYGVKFAKDRKGADLQEAKRWMAHGITGVALMSLAGALAKEGIVNADNGDDTTKKERGGEEFYEQQKAINVTKLRKFLMGEDVSNYKGGLNVDLKWMGVMGTLMNIEANKLEEMTDKQKQESVSYMEDFMSTLRMSSLELIDNGVFSNASGLATAFTKGGSFADAYFMNLINLGANIIQPAMYAQFSRAALPYYSSTKADDFWGKVKNNFLTRDAVLRKLTNQYPPSKIGIWGDRLDKKDNTIMRLFSMSQSNKDNFAQPIYDDYKRTKNTKFFPPTIKPTLNGEKLTTKQIEQLEVLVGQARKNMALPFIHNGAILGGYEKRYKDLSDEEKIDALSVIYEEGYQQGVEQFLTIYPEFEKKPKTEKEVERQISKKIFRAIK